MPAQGTSLIGGRSRTSAHLLDTGAARAEGVAGELYGAAPASRAAI